MPARDTVLRWIEEAARIVERLLHGPGAVDLEQALVVIDDAAAQLLGPLRDLVPQLEVESVAELLSDPDRLFGYARLLALQAAVEQAKGAGTAESTRARAAAIARAAASRHAVPPAGWSEWADQLDGRSA